MDAAAELIAAERWSSSTSFGCWMPRLLKRAWCVAAMHARVAPVAATRASPSVRARMRASGDPCAAGRACAGVAACWRTSLESLAWGSLALDSALRCMVAIGETFKRAVTRWCPPRLCRASPRSGRGAAGHSSYRTHMRPRMQGAPNEARVRTRARAPMRRACHRLAVATRTRTSFAPAAVPLTPREACGHVRVLRRGLPGH